MKKWKLVPKSSSDDDGIFDYAFDLKGAIGGVKMISCMHCTKSGNCKRQKKVVGIMFDAVKRIEEETNITSMAELCLYNIFKPECQVNKEE